MPRRKERSRSQGDLQAKPGSSSSRASFPPRCLGESLFDDAPGSATGSPSKSQSLRKKVGKQRRQEEEVVGEEDLVYAKREFPGEGIYEGLLHDGKRHGQGLLRTRGGIKVFEGQWLNDKRHGYGLSKYDGGNRHEGLYVMGKRHGLGVFLWANGDKYSGNFALGSIDGYGRFEWANGDVYLGHWRQGVIDGEGCMKRADGQVLQGCFARGQLCGWARKKLPGGDSYSGYVVSNNHEGYGEYRWLAGEHYEGQWRNNAIHGYGCFESSSSSSSSASPNSSLLHSGGSTFSVYTGHFVAGKPNGFGEYRFDTQSCTAKGCWDEEGRGWARICYDSGLVYEGGCRDGKREGQGELSYLIALDEFPSTDAVEQLKEEGAEEVLKTFGGRLVGTFEDDQLNGVALLILANGQVLRALFNHDTFSTLS
eukprot:gene7855-8668_t